MLGGLMKYCSLLTSVGTGNDQCRKITIIFRNPLFQSYLHSLQFTLNIRFNVVLRILQRLKFKLYEFTKDLSC